MDEPDHQPPAAVCSATGSGATDAESGVVSLRLPAIVAVSAGTMAMTIDGTIMSAALPRLAVDLSVSASTAVLVITIYQLVTLVSLLPLAAMGERIGQRRLYQIGLVVFTLGSGLCALAPSFSLLMAARALQAFGAAASLGSGSAMIRAIYPPYILGRGLGINTVVAAATASVAPMLGGLILHAVGWPWLFMAGVPFAILSLAAGAFSLPETERRQTTYDFLGALLYAVSLGLLALALQAIVSSSQRWLPALLAGGGLVVGTTFVLRERSKVEPILPFDLLGRRLIAFSSAASLCAFTAMMVFLVALPFRLQTAFGFTIAAAGAALLPLPLVSMIVGPLSGALSDRAPAGLISGVGMAVSAVGTLLLALLPASPSAFDVLWRVTVCGAGFGVSFSPLSRQVIAAAPMNRTAAAGALGITVRGLGQTLGATAIAGLLAVGAGVTPIPMIVIGALCVAGAAFSAATLLKAGVANP